MKRYAVLGMVVLVCLMQACSRDRGDTAQEYATTAIDTQLYDLAVPAHFPAMSIPKDNPLTKNKVALGERLFFDPNLSIDGSVSCASCHISSYAFSDTVALSRGANEAVTERNSPALMNVGFHPYLMREGAVPNLEMQVLSPLEGMTEMAHNVVQACGRLNDDPSYVRLFQIAFGDSVTPFTLTRALASYQRTLIGGDAPFDAFLLGDTSVLSPAALKGYELFTSDRLACKSCHSGVLLSDFGLKNNGLETRNEDPGLMRLTLKENDRGRFKVPSLRNIALTAPYMHDGRFKTLSDVLDHYDKGGDGTLNQPKEIHPLHLMRDERKALLAFFESLTESRARTPHSSTLP